MNDVLASAVATHGGISRWRACAHFDLDVDIDGPLMQIVKSMKMPCRLRVQGTTQYPSIQLRGLFANGDVAQVTLQGVSVGNGQNGFARNVASNPQAQLRSVFCAAAAAWTAISAPFAFVQSGARIEVPGLARPHDHGQMLKVFADDPLSAFSRQTTAGVDADGLLRRLVYPHPLGVSGAPTWLHLLEGQVVFDGLVVATLQRIYKITDREKPSPANLVMSMKIRSARFY